MVISELRRSGATTAGLLAAGVTAGPLFLVSSGLQGLVRSEFRFSEHPPSALALGGAGWVQTATFVVAGSLFVLGASGMRRRMTGTGARWAPRLIAVLGVALVAGGVFEMDPAFGFPPGTPPGVGEVVSWHAAVHGVLFPLGFAAIVGACVVMAHRFGQQPRRGWQWYCIVTAPVTLVLSLWPSLGARPDGRFLPMWVGVAVAFVWTSFVVNEVRRERRPTA